MTIIYTATNIFTTPASVLTCPVNTVGVMGAGLAVPFSKRYPEVSAAYKEHCRKGFPVGTVLYSAPALFFPTKTDWRKPSRLEYIEQGLQDFVKRYKELKIEKIAFPKLGCGRGQLTWEDVLPVMIKHLKPLDIMVWIHI